MKYLVVGGNPFTCYTGTTSFTSLDVVGKANSWKEAADIFNNKYDECSGLLLIIDMETGEPAIDPNRKE